MKHVLVVVKPYPDVNGRRAARVELDYLRLVYTIGEMRKQGQNAHGYFIVIGDQIPRQMNKWEEDYKGKQCVELISTLPTSHISTSLRRERIHDLSGMVTAAILGKTAATSSPKIIRDMADFITTETILDLEPGVRRIKDKNKFPFGIPLDYYGVV